jgi:hypothetical protein
VVKTGRQSAFGGGEIASSKELLQDYRTGQQGDAFNEAS